VAEGKCDEVLGESSLEVVVHSLEIQDAEPIRWHRCPRPPRLVMVGSSFWRMISSTQQQ
jgi:hypothetical protein